MAGGMGILWGIGNEHVWTGAVGGLFAIAVRALYLSSDETENALGPDGPPPFWGRGRGFIALENIAAVNTMFSAVQVVTVTGD